MSLFRKSHNALCGGYGSYTSQVPCEVCGSQLFSYKIGGCKSCHDKKKAPNKYLAETKSLRKRTTIDALLEQKRLERELGADSYAGI